MLNYALKIWSLPPGGETDKGHVSGGETLLRDFNNCKPYFGQGLNLISIGVKLCFRNVKFTAMAGETDEVHVSGGET